MTLFITTRGVLMYQMKKQIGGRLRLQRRRRRRRQWAPVKGVNVGMVQTFVAQLKEPSSTRSAARSSASWKTRN
jgi:cell division FtsZ-interacting protein ZapD